MEESLIYKKQFEDIALKKLNILRKQKNILYKDAYLENKQAIECSARTQLFINLSKNTCSSDEVIELYHGLVVLFMEIDKNVQ